MPDKSNTILLLAAVEHELMPTAQRLGLQHEAERQSGKVGDQHVIAAMTGIGRERCRQVTETLIAAHRPQWIINIGFAGSLKPDTPVGQVLQFNAVTDGSDNIIFLDQSDRSEPLLLTHDKLAFSTELKRQLAKQYRACAVDMESFYIAELALQKHICLSVIRAISDPLEMTLPEAAPKWIKPDGTADIAAATRFLVTHPQQIPALMKLQRNAALAGGKLADYVAAMLGER